MSDEVISIEEVIAYSLDTFPGLIEDRNWGERSLFYNPDRQLPKGTYFLTFKERDGAHDSASRIRPGDYRLNVGISKVAFTNRFGAVPARPAAGGVVQTGHDFSQPDRIVPHPIYMWLGKRRTGPTWRTFCRRWRRWSPFVGRWSARRS